MNRTLSITTAVAMAALTTTAGLSAHAAAKPPRPTFIQPGLYQAEPVNTPLGFALADFNSDGHLDVASAGVFSENPNTTTPRGLPVQPGDGEGHLGPAHLTTMPSKTDLESPIAIAADDVNGDAKPDIVAATLDLDFSGIQTVITYRMRVLMGHGDGTFSVLKGFVLPAESDHVVLADFDGDGDLDLAYTTHAPDGDNVWTAAGKGDGTFAKPFAITKTQQLSISTLAAADLNNDHQPDLVYGQGCVVARLNTGGGGFGEPICNALTDYPQSVAVADLNEDGIADIALGDASGGHIRVAAGDGNGHFTTVNRYSEVASQILSVVTTDVDGDGHVDIVASGDAAASSQTAIAVFRGAGDGSFRLASRWVSAGAHLTVGDLAEDGKPDLVGDDTALHRPAILTINAGKGHFRAPQLTVAPAKKTAGQLAKDVFTGDFDNSGSADVMLVAANAIIVYLNRGGGTYVKWSAPLISYGSGTILSAALGDLNSDGDLDVALGGLPNDNVTVLLGHGDGSFGKPATYNNGSGAAALSIAIGDVTGDSNPDIVTNTFTSLSVLPGRKNGTLGAPILSGSSQANQSVLHLTDLDDDGDLDAVGAAKTGNPDNASTEVTTASNTGKGIFSNSRATSLPTNLGDGVVADFTGDGKLDLAISGAAGRHTGISGLFVMPGTTTGLGAAIVDPTQEIPGGLDAADYNGDGTIDLATTTSVDTMVFSNPGNGRFAPVASGMVVTPNGATAVTSALYTNDGRPDIVTFLSSNPPEFALDVNNTR